MKEEVHNMNPEEYQNYNTSSYYQEPQDAMGNVATGLREALEQEVVAKSFLYMVAALVVTAIAAFYSPELMARWLVSSRMNIYLLFFAEIGIVMASNAAMRSNNVPLSAVLFTLYSYINGAVIGIIFWAYELASVGSIFLMTAAMFAVMAVYGLVTKRDLSSIGNICLMGLIGIIIASFVNIFLLKSSTLELGISVIGILIFVGLTAYDVQKIKERARYSTSDNVAVMALGGAFNLYLDFINLFLKLLRLFGKRK